MNNTNRPHIIIVNEPPAPSVRTYDGGGGGGTYPRTDFQRHASKIFSEAQSLKAALDAIVPDQRSKIYYRVEIPKDFGNIWTSKGQKLEDDLHGEIIGAPAPHVGHMSSRAESFSLLLDQLQTYTSSGGARGKSKFAPLESISKIPFNEKVSKRLQGIFDANAFDNKAIFGLFPDLTKEEVDAYVQAIDIFLKNANGKVVDVIPSESGALLTIQSDEKTLKDCAERFIGVQSVEPSDEAVVLSSTKLGDLTDSLLVNTNNARAIVCVFDSGVIRNARFFDSSVRAWEEPLGQPFSVDHGSFVASRIIYGDSLRDQHAAGTLTPDCKVLSVCLFSVDAVGNRKAPSGEEIVRVIRDTVQRWHSQVKVYNLSVNLGCQNPNVSWAVADDTVGALAAEIDALSRRYDILFVVSTGNFSGANGNRPTNYPEYFDADESRIAAPAEALLALSVGSIALRENTGSMVSRGFPSPFTRRGPGFSGFPKPDLVAHGGNRGLSWREVDDLAAVGIGSDATEACLSYGTGTSYAAPLVSRAAAFLFDSIPNVSAPLVRAMLSHFASSAEGADYNSTFSEERLKELIGSGLPRPELMSFSRPSCQSYIFQGSIRFREIMNIPFFVPRSLIDRKGKKVKIRLTVASSPETNKALKAGYCKSHLRVKLMKLNSESVLKDISVSDNAENIAEKYFPLYRIEKTFTTQVSHGEWAVVVEHVSRWKLKEESMKFALVLSVEDPQSDSNIDIYQAIRTEIPNKYQNELVLANTIRL